MPLTGLFQRFATNPLLTVAQYPQLEDNINGPSVIETPAWLPNPLGRYYMYFAHHQGRSIRLAYADDLRGPWQLYEPGTLQLEETPCSGHIASPDVHVNEDRQSIEMYYHGPILSPQEWEQDDLTHRFPYLYGQRTLLARSADGVNFDSGTRILGPSYWRYFRFRQAGYALAMPGILYRQIGQDPEEFQEGPCLFGPECRHFAVDVCHEELTVYFSRAGDLPERILGTRLDTRDQWLHWTAGPLVEVLCPAAAYEGANEPLVASARGAIHEPAHQLRDPCILRQGDDVWLFYAIAGEQGIAGAKFDSPGHD